MEVKHFNFPVSNTRSHTINEDLALFTDETVCLPFVDEQTNSTKAHSKWSFNGKQQLKKKKCSLSKWQAMQIRRTSCQQSLLKQLENLFSSSLCNRLQFIAEFESGKSLPFIVFFTSFFSISFHFVLFFVVGKMSCFNALFEM